MSAIPTNSRVYNNSSNMIIEFKCNYIPQKKLPLKLYLMTPIRRKLWTTMAARLNED